MDKEEIKKRAGLREGAQNAANEKAKASIQKSIDDLIRRLEEVEASDTLTDKEKREQAGRIRTTIQNWTSKWTTQ